MTTIDDLSTKLRDVANRDEIISKEEEHLISSIEDFISRYKLYKRKAKADGVIDDQEKERLKEMKKGILEGAWVTSMEDGSISDDESELISTIYDFLKGLKV